MKRIIYRVDDRFIHGQVIEGWINYYRIPNVILVNDRIAADACQRMIYESAVPPGSRLYIASVEDFQRKKLYRKFKKGSVLVIVGSVEDLYFIKNLPDSESYINLGCLAMGDRAIKVTDNVYLSSEQLDMLREVAACHDVFAHKLPWDMPVDMNDFIKRSDGLL